MPFKLKSYLPSKQREVLVKELTYKQYRELVKSLYSIDKQESIKQYNSVLLELCEDIKDIDITFEDKLSLLFTVRNYCVSPDLKLKVTGTDKNVFTYSVTIDNLINNLKEINKSDTITWKDVTVDISGYKVRDEEVFIGNNKDIIKIMASCIDTVTIQNKTTSFKELPHAERVHIVNSFPYNLYKVILQKLEEQQNKYEEQDLLIVKNPLTKETVLRFSRNVTFETLQQLINFCFAEELPNVYRAFYNIVHYANFTPEYVDSITPIEMQVYWMYYMEDMKRKTTETKNTNNLQLPTRVEDKLGF